MATFHIHEDEDNEIIRKVHSEETKQLIYSIIDMGAENVNTRTARTAAPTGAIKKKPLHETTNLGTNYVNDGKKSSIKEQENHKLTEKPITAPDLDKRHERRPDMANSYDRNIHTRIDISENTILNSADIILNVSEDIFDISDLLDGSDNDSPMSAELIISDKNQIVQSEKKCKGTMPRNDRERFFEVVEYQRDILAYFRESEVTHCANPNYMQRQTNINNTMRTILVDWLVDVGELYKLENETLYLAVSFVDRFLSHMLVVRTKLQLVGAAAMFIAAKYEEIYYPDADEFIDVTDNAYSKDQLMRMERIILKTLNFDLTTPTANAFINTYAVLCDMPAKWKYLTLYISELTLLKADPYLHFYPSITTAAALALAALTLGRPIWSPELEDLTTYSLNDLKELILFLSKTHKAATTNRQQAVQRKYKSEKYGKIAEIQPLDLNEAQLESIILEYYAEQTVQN